MSKEEARIAWFGSGIQQAVWDDVCSFGADMAAHPERVGDLHLASKLYKAYSVTDSSGNLTVNESARDIGGTLIAAANGDSISTAAITGARRNARIMLDEQRLAVGSFGRRSAARTVGTQRA